MGLTSSLFAGLTGMKTNEFRMDVIGNNISNVNTYAFKSSRVNFQTQFLRTLSFGSAPSGAMGGTSPMQVGTGSMVGAMNRDFSEGSPETTGGKTDLAVQGDGMFALTKPDGGQVYTRDGSFQFNAENYLLSADGYFLQGYAVDDNFNVVEGPLENLRIALGEITTASTTTLAVFSGDLNAEGESAINPETGEANGNVRSRLTSQALSDAGGALTAGTLMIDLENASGNIVIDGNVITLDSAVKGGQTLSQETFDITATTTLGEFLSWLEDVLGIFTITDYPGLPDFTGDTNPTPNPGVSINATSDGIDIVGNTGSYNILELGNKALKVSKGSAVSAPSNLPFTFSVVAGTEQLAPTEEGNIESVRTSFRAYDSLGIPLDIDVTMVMESKDANGGITWRYFAECSEDSDGSRAAGTGTITFDGNGTYLEGDDLVITVSRENTGAATPQTITLNFSEMDGYAMNNAISLLSQDGFKSGTLQDFSIGPDGIIIGSFTNGLTRNLGQVVLVTFRNYEGLIAGAGNIYSTGPNSGSAIIKKPQELGAGSVKSGALELSNVDLSREFINLIITSTGFSASSRVIQTSDRLLSELMMLTR